jgi:cation transport ATPase
MTEPHLVQTAPEIAADVLAAAVERAIKVERERSDRETEVAVKVAKREAKVDHELDGHEQHLEAINNTIIKTGESLDALKTSVDTFHDDQNKRNEKLDTEAELHWRKTGQAYSKRMVYAGFGTMIVMLLVPFVNELARLLGG